MVGTFTAFALFMAPVDDLPRRGVLGAALAPVSPEVRTKLELKPGEGVVATAATPGLTAQKAGIQPGDVLLSINDKRIAPGVLGEAIRATPAGQSVTFQVRRGEGTLNLTAKLVEKPRDPGNANFSVEYRHIVSHGQKMRTILTVPRKPGKHPGFFFIQGFSPVSYDFTLEGSKGDVTTLNGPLLLDFANGGFVTIRVEKPGVGDSEGGPFPDLDFHTETEIYRQALKQLKAHPAVNPDEIFIFGHSMGGAFGPIIATESPVRGIAVYGTAARTWMEYLLDILRYQNLLGGASFEAVDDQVRAGSRLMALVLQQGMSVADVKKNYPDLAATADAMMPGGMFNGKTPKFWAQLAEINFARYWAKVKCDVLAARGVSDFVTYDVDHKLIADVVNRATPGRGRFAPIPNSDHLFHQFETELEAQRNYSRGNYGPGFSQTMMAWIREVLAKPKAG